MDKIIRSLLSKICMAKRICRFSVSPSICERTKKYIENQQIHHKKIDAHEEYLMFLKEYNIEYDEKYLWDD
ncbi:hypothetical protein M2480_000314 [Parabacteroides sp. PFB2-12]|nr:hypothetical protein [Parabacteroides sp. PM6-13]MDH6389354.1 hypothetical protein [Parabacteroides sp. PFB2-12]